MAQNVGPILEMVTEKYLLRSETEWRARQEAMTILDEVVAALAAGDLRRIATATMRNFTGPIQQIIPWATNQYTETLIQRVRQQFGADFWGFWMLGGMSGGGMGFIFDPARRAEGQTALAEIMSAAKRELQDALPFAMEPVVYDFAINDRGTWCDQCALLPAEYYALIVPGLLHTDRRALSVARRAELEQFGHACRTQPELGGLVATMFDRLFPRPPAAAGRGQLRERLAELGFDMSRSGRICRPGASASRKTGCRPPRSLKMSVRKMSCRPMARIANSV